MISKETFVEVMNKLETLDKKMNDVDVAMKALSPDFCGLYVPQTFYIVLDILTNIFNDKSDWLSYFMFELDWLHDWKPGDVLVNDKPVDLSTWDKAYDFLINNMNENKND